MVDALTPPRADSAVRRKAAPAVAAAVFLAMTLLYTQTDGTFYFDIIARWGFEPYSVPFLDTHYVLSSLQCSRLGIDVVTGNPCDMLGRVYDYSPLWLAAAPLPVTTAATVPIGFGLNIVFLLSLMLLPPGRGWPEDGAIIAATLSTATAYAVERGNTDLLMFASIALVGALSGRMAVLRSAGYGLVLVLGMLKYYPLAVLGVAVRERPRYFILLTAISALVIAAFIYWNGRELLRVLPLIPHGSYFVGSFGAKQLSGGIANMLKLPPSAATGGELALLLLALTLGVRFGLGTKLRADLAALTEAERAFLMIGSLTLVGCFLSAQNIGYRAVFIILVMPGLSALWRVRRGSVVYAIGTLGMIALAWADGWRSWLDTFVAEQWHGQAIVVFVETWAVREVLWWLEITVLLGMLTGLLIGSEMARTLGIARPNR